MNKELVEKLYAEGVQAIETGDLAKHRKVFFQLAEIEGTTSYQLALANRSDLLEALKEGMPASRAIDSESAATSAETVSTLLETDKHDWLGRPKPSYQGTIGLLCQAYSKIRFACLT